MIIRHSPAAEAFRLKGIPAREFFAHRAEVIRKLYPDTLLLLEGRGMKRRDLLRCEFLQLNLYSDQLSGLPEELFTDPAVNWHNQQLGQKGLIAAAGLCIRKRTLTITVMQSDLCQQLFRHPDLKRTSKTQVEKRFGAWYKLLFNAIVDFAVQHKIREIYSPTARWILHATKKRVQPGLFERVYDFPGEFYNARRVMREKAEHWEVAVPENAARAVRLVPGEAPRFEREKLICIFHDTEENVDTPVSAEECRGSLTRMLAVEKTANVRTTYDVLGSLFESKRREIGPGGHCLAFHSFDHQPAAVDQLPRCREVDLQVRGYRPPQSRITPELSDDSLAYFNFEWLASGFPSLGTNVCRLDNGIVKIPILTDDYPLATGKMQFEGWRKELFESFRGSDVLAFGLHDCYARHWLDSYAELLAELKQLGRFVTADELCDLTYRQQG